MGSTRPLQLADERCSCPCLSTVANRSRDEVPSPLLRWKRLWYRRTCRGRRGLEVGQQGHNRSFEIQHNQSGAVWLGGASRHQHDERDRTQSDTKPTPLGRRRQEQSDAPCKPTEHRDRNHARLRNSRRATKHEPQQHPSDKTEGPTKSPTTHDHPPPAVQRCPPPEKSCKQTGAEQRQDVETLDPTPRYPSPVRQAVSPRLGNVSLPGVFRESPVCRCVLQNDAGDRQETRGQPP